MPPPSFGTGAPPEPTRLRQVALVVRDLDKARKMLVSLLGFMLDGNLFQLFEGLHVCCFVFYYVYFVLCYVLHILIDLSSIAVFGGSRFGEDEGDVSTFSLSHWFLFSV